jgi:hypothetical protein
MSTLFRAALIAVACSTGGAALACPEVAQTGQSLAYTSDEAWTPRSHPVVAGGGVDLSACASVPGTGYVATAPDFELNFTANGAGRALEFRVRAECDTVLLVNDARGAWHFNDDDSDLNPRLRLAAAPEGIYDIWIGTFGPSTCSAELIVETF